MPLPFQFHRVAYEPPKYETVTVRIEDPEVFLWLEKKLRSCGYRKRSRVKFPNEYTIDFDNLFTWIEEPVDYNEPYVNRATVEKWALILNWYYSDTKYGELE